MLDKCVTVCGHLRELYNAHEDTCNLTLLLYTVSVLRDDFLQSAENYNYIRFRKNWFTLSFTIYQGVLTPYFQEHPPSAQLLKLLRRHPLSETPHRPTLLLYKL